MGTMFDQTGQVVHGAQFNVGLPDTAPGAAALRAAMDTAIHVDRTRRQVVVEVFAPEDNGMRGLSPISIIYAKGVFDHIRVCDDLDDSDEGSSLEAWIAANGDECWASLADHRGGPTLSLDALAAEAARLSVSV